MSRKGLIIGVFFILIALTLSMCTAPDSLNINQVILNDESSYFYVNTTNYPQDRTALPIGIFDSGTGGLTVMDAIVKYDGYDNTTNIPMKMGDGKPDFQKEYFIYLGDQANMPYGNYTAEKNVELLQEHIIKDVQFLIGNKYYRTANTRDFQTDKLPVKSIVIACNTATAFGKEIVDEFVRQAELDIHVIGVIGAGVKGAFEHIDCSEDCNIGVMATAGTVASLGYVNTIRQYVQANNYTGQLSVFQQAGIGQAGAIDGSPEYIFPDATRPFNEYRGPSLHNESALIDTSILKRYDFDWSGILYTGSREHPDEIQLNSVENYIRYHVVTLLEKMRISSDLKPLKVIILGCTHYPFYTDQITAQLQRLYLYEENGWRIYQAFMNENIILVDPAVNTARELYNYLNEMRLFNNLSIQNSEFYISVPNPANPNNQFDTAGNFTYEYKYGRRAGDIQEYVKRVPFSRESLTNDIIVRLHHDIPVVYQLINGFNSSNSKMEYLGCQQKL